MKEDKKNGLKEKFKDKRFRAIMFFGFYFVFFLVIISLANGSKASQDTNGTNNDVVTVRDKWQMLTDNYEYLYDINITNNNVVTNVELQGKRYQNKTLFTKTVNHGDITSIYTFYINAYIKTNNEYIKTNNFLYVDDTFDNNLIDISYIKEMIKPLTAKNKVTNFDDSINEYYEYQDMNIDVTSKENLISKITIKKANIDITLQYKNINKVGDFVVETKGN